MITCDLCGKKGRSDVIGCYQIALRDPQDECDEGPSYDHKVIEINLCKDRCVKQYADAMQVVVSLHAQKLQQDRGTA